MAAKYQPTGPVLEFLQVLAKLLADSEQQSENSQTQPGARDGVAEIPETDLVP